MSEGLLLAFVSLQACKHLGLIAFAKKVEWGLLASSRGPKTRDIKLVVHSPKGSKA